jgi:flagellin-like protein
MTADTTDEPGSNRAVSPVIGVILMVAITVILAAVIGAFVLEIGDQQETAPNTSFDSDERVVFVVASGPSTNVSIVEISHAGGAVLDITNTKISVSGSGGAWGFSDLGKLEGGSQPPGDPQPDVRKTLGKNDQSGFSSGQTWNVVASSERETTEYVKNTDYTLRTGPMKSYTPVFGNVEGNVPRFWLSGDIQTDGSGNNIWPSPTLQEEAGGRTGRSLPILEQDDSVKVVWTASSGGKTQTLFKYSVQSGSPDW